MFNWFGFSAGGNFVEAHLAQRLVLGLLDADQRGIAQLVDARLNGQHRGQRHLHILKEAALQLALHADAAVLGFDLHDDGGVRPAQQLRQQHAGLRIAEVVRLQAGEDQVEGFILDRRGKGARNVEGVQGDEAVVFQMNGAVGALGQRLAQHLLRPRRTGGDHHHFAAVLFPLPQRLFQRIRVGFVHLIAHVFTNPGCPLIQLQRRVLLRYLLHANQDLHPAPRWKFNWTQEQHQSSSTAGTSPQNEAKHPAPSRAASS